MIKWFDQATPASVIMYKLQIIFDAKAINICTQVSKTICLYMFCVVVIKRGPKWRDPVWF